MSDVRMCDFTNGDGNVCGTIFSTREEGWSAGNITVIGENGQNVTEHIDLCPEHSPSGTQRKRNIPRFKAQSIPFQQDVDKSPSLPEPQEPDWSTEARSF